MLILGEEIYFYPEGSFIFIRNRYLSFNACNSLYRASVFFVVFFFLFWHHKENFRCATHARSLVMTITGDMRIMWGQILGEP